MKLTVKKAAWLLNVPAETIYDWISQNSIPFAYVKDQYLFNRVELLEWASMMNLTLSKDVFALKRNEDEGTPDFTDALNTGGVHFLVPGCDLAGVSAAIVKSLRLPENTDFNFLADILMSSEYLGYNAIGEGIAIPQVRNPMVLNVEKSFVTLCYMEHPIELNATDNIPVHALFTIVSTSINKHLYLLSRLLCLLGFQEVKEALIKKMPAKELLELFSYIEKKLMEDAKDSTPPINQSPNSEVR